MFSLQVRTVQHTPEAKAGIGGALLGRLLGFAGGLALVFALDAFVLDHAMQTGLLRNDWGITRAARNLAAFVLR